MNKIAFALLLAFTGWPVVAQDISKKPDLKKTSPGKLSYSPYVGKDFPSRVYFGDTHLHTSYSMDAGAFGARLTPRDAYVFAKGKEIMAWVQV